MTFLSPQGELILEFTLPASARGVLIPTEGDMSPREKVLSSEKERKLFPGASV